MRITSEQDAEEKRQSGTGHQRCCQTVDIVLSFDTRHLSATVSAQAALEILRGYGKVMNGGVSKLLLFVQYLI